MVISQPPTPGKSYRFIIVVVRVPARTQDSIDVTKELCPPSRFVIASPTPKEIPAISLPFPLPISISIPFAFALRFTSYPFPFPASDTTHTIRFHLPSPPRVDHDRTLPPRLTTHHRITGDRSHGSRPALSSISKGKYHRRLISPSLRIVSAQTISKERLFLFGTTSIDLPSYFLPSRRLAKVNETSTSGSATHCPPPHHRSTGKKQSSIVGWQAVFVCVCVSGNRSNSSSGQSISSTSTSQQDRKHERKALRSWQWRLEKRRKDRRKG